MKIGFFAIGGGLATIPFLRELSQKYDWFDEAQLMNMIAVSESTPGPLGVNMATFAGYNTAGIAGALAATLALVLPSVIIIITVSKFMNSFSKSAITAGTFRILRPAAVGLIAGAVSSLFALTLLNFSDGNMQVRAAPLVLYAVFTIVYFISENNARIKLHPLFFIAAGAVSGIILGGRL
jgi:chromate transporter